jgi:hypothetical protein
MASYATPADLRSHIDQDTADDTNLQAILDAATAAIDLHCRRPDGFVALTVATARTFSGSGGTVQVVDEFVAATTANVSVAVKDSSLSTSYTAWASDDFILATGDQLHPDFNRSPRTLLLIDPNGDYAAWTAGQPTVQVTAKWGYAATVPASVKLACIMQSVRWYRRLSGSMADTTGSAELGTVMYTKGLDPEVAWLLNVPGIRRMAV